MCKIKDDKQINLSTFFKIFIYGIIILSITTLFVRHFAMSAPNLLSVEFEVFGVVQGVFFRKYTQEQSKKLGLQGWCMNTSKGTVKGVLEGPSEKVNEMKSWLQHTGSPSSKIDKAEFGKEKSIQDYSFSGFTIKH